MLDVPSVQIKNVPEVTHRVLRRRAAEAHQSLQEYLLTKLIEDAASPTLGEVFDEIEVEFEREGGGLKLSPQQIADLVREDRESH
jgi:antitoxin FitA